jgi:hypothetical protein
MIHPSSLESSEMVCWVHQSGSPLPISDAAECDLSIGTRNNLPASPLKEAKSRFSVRICWSVSILGDYGSIETGRMYTEFRSGGLVPIGSVGSCILTRSLGMENNGLDPIDRRSRLEEWKFKDMYLHDPGEENRLCLLSCVICQFALLFRVSVG